MFMANQWDCTLNYVLAGMCWWVDVGLCLWTCANSPSASLIDTSEGALLWTRTQLFRPLKRSCQGKHSWKLAFFIKYLSQLHYTTTAITTTHLAKLNYFILLIGRISIIKENFLTAFYSASHSHQKKKQGKKKCTIQTDLPVPTDLCNDSSLFDK